MSCQSMTVLIYIERRLGPFDMNFQILWLPHNLFTLAVGGVQNVQVHALISTQLDSQVQLDCSQLDSQAPPSVVKIQPRP